ncbi:GNAT family N-acetyltransferase [Candidatus Pelagibacter bacterium]|nr:GNAT family N-acetyltransferase [Candidatus Pelagibacter bacterium]
MIKIITDDWLSIIINKPAYSLQKFNTNLTQKDLPEGQIFVWSKISVDDIEKLVCLQNLGFYVVDTNVQFSLSKELVLKNNFNIRFANSSDEMQIRLIAKNAFKHSRFYRDPYISNEIACKIKEEWVGNFFLGKRGKWMIVVEEDSHIKGFLQLVCKSKDTIVIDLIAIDEKNRGKGLAKDMISFAYVNCLKKKGIIEVGTQIANTSSIKFYSKIGFNMNSASYVLHKHN